MNSQQNYLQPQRSLSSSISSSRTPSVYASHTYESTQFSSPKISNASDEIVDSKKSLTGVNLMNILFYLK
jgi:hypothetical protein